MKKYMRLLEMFVIKIILVCSETLKKWEGEKPQISVLINPKIQQGL